MAVVEAKREYADPRDGLGVRHPLLSVPALRVGDDVEGPGAGTGDELDAVDSLVLVGDLHRVRGRRPAAVVAADVVGALEAAARAFP
ncbi:hypothetical protein [Streptomyces sp. NPDC048272]|uniref:hypothetical protein n=1 Tax=Streptomyces sp. NPDC048272 TaxID=3154616 RepID=UPI00342927BB